MNRRRFLTLTTAGFGMLGLGSCGARFGLSRFARPPPPDGPLSPAARALLDRAWEGLTPALVLDMHAHLVGRGVGGTGAFVSERMTQPLPSPWQYLQFLVYTMAAGIDDFDRADQQYIQKLAARVRSQRRHGRLVLLAFDRVYRQDGAEDCDATEIHTPNDWALRLAQESPDCFLAGASVHPYRKDSLAELERVAAAGAVLVKWLPNSQHIDPGSPKCEAFYRKLAELKLPLLTHAGEEKALGAGSQNLGNPLLLRRALDLGTKVIVAHCASLGRSADLDAPGINKPFIDDFRLFMRLADDGRYRDRLWADISAITQSNRCDVLPELLSRTDLHERLVYGTDYPLAAINGLTPTRKLVDLGLLTAQDQLLLDEIKRHNPLAFDLALKRSLTCTRGGKAVKLPSSVFQVRAELFPTLA